MEPTPQPAPWPGNFAVTMSKPYQDLQAQYFAIKQRAEKAEAQAAELRQELDHKEQHCLHYLDKLNAKGAECEGLRELGQLPGMPEARCHGCGLPAHAARCRNAECPMRTAATTSDLPA